MSDMEINEKRENVLLGLHELIQMYFAYQNKEVYPDQTDFKWVEERLQAVLKEIQSWK